jgi:hypothetical protein
MTNKLLVGILGKEKSGKTLTWDIMFGKPVRTGKNLRRLYFNEKEYTEVFLLSRSPSKRHIDVSAIMQSNEPGIVLCSLQYTSSVKRTLKFFIDKGYLLFIHWLNPGFNDEHEAPLFYNTGIINHILAYDSLVGIRNGKIDPEDRVREVKDYIYGWAKSNNLIKEKRIIRKAE